MYVDHEWDRGVANYVPHLDKNVHAHLLVDSLFPELATEELKVNKRRRDLTGTLDNGKIVEEGLLSARDFLASLRLLLHVFIRCAAARPRDSENRIVGELVRV